MGENGKIKVLLPGPLSYLGRRLMIKLLARPDIRLRVLAVDRRTLGDLENAIPEIVEGDPLDREVLKRATEGVDVAFYPVRFLGTNPVFLKRRKVFPAMYRDACIESGVRRIIFLGAHRMEDEENEMLRTLIHIGEDLSARPDAIQTVWFRTGLDLGSGSLLFEALRNMVQKLPVLPTPRWMETRVPVIGVRDVLNYLIEAIYLPPGGSLVVEIGIDPLSIREMLVAMARVMNLKRVFIPLPVSAKRLSPFVLMLITPYSAFLASMFLQILQTLGKTPGTFSTDRARELFPSITPVPFEVAVARAVEAIEHEQVISRWTDSIPTVYRADLEEEISRSVFRDVREESFAGIPPENIFRAVKSIGGKEGWFSFNVLWRIRGVMDKLLGGFGDSLGRRTESDLRVGDILDVWKVIDLQENRRLLLEAHMKVGGKAWLEFRIVGNTLVQTAYHYPKGLMGRIYWFSMLPFHAFIFPDMIRSIIRQAGGGK
jgi:uncharacterized protein YbjT (DUF2867 family)